MAYTQREQELYDFGKGALPSWFFLHDRAEEFFTAFVKIFDAVRANLEESKIRACIEDATGIWLDIHARDHGLYRAENETDLALRVRIKSVLDAITRPLILAAVKTIVDQDVLGATVAGLEIMRDGGHFGDYVAQTGTGGTFSVPSVGLMKFVPDIPFQLPLEVGFTRSGAQGNPRLVISGSASNDGTYEIISLEDNGAVYAAAGAAGVDASASWEAKHYDIEGNDRTNFPRAYFGRGYRFASKPGFIIILPDSVTESTRQSVDLLARQIKAFGVFSSVELQIGIGP